MIAQESRCNGVCPLFHHEIVVACGCALHGATGAALMARENLCTLKFCMLIVVGVCLGKFPPIVLWVFGQALVYLLRRMFS